MKPVLMRALLLGLMIVGLALAPAANADRAQQAQTATPTPTMRFLRLSPAPATRTPRVSPTPVAGGREEATSTPSRQGTPARTRLAPQATPRTTTTPGAATPRALATPRTTGTPGALPETGNQPQPGGPLSEGFDENLLQNLNELDSYRMQSAVTWNLDDGRTGNADVTTEIVTDPPAQRWSLTLRQSGRRTATYIFVSANGQTRMNYQGQWREVAAPVQALVSRFAWAIDPQEYLDLSQGAYIRTENVNGLSAERYRYTTEAFAPSREVVELEGARADIWIAPENDIPARIRMQLIGTDPVGGSGVYGVVSNLVAVNEPISITLPAVASPEELPATGETELILADILKLPMFDTYRVHGTIRWDQEGSGGQGSATFLISVDQQQPAETAVVTVTQGLVDLPFEYVNIAGAAYIRTGNRWMSAEQFALPALAEQLGWIGDPHAYVAAGEGRLVGRETVSGLETEHYVFERDAIGTLPLLAEIEDAEVEAWYAPEEDAYVRVIAHVEGTDERGARGVYDLESEVTNIDEPVNIERPADFPAR